MFFTLQSAKSGNAPDLVRHRFYQFLEGTYLYWHLAFAVLLTLAGAWHFHSWREFDLSFVVILLLGLLTWPLGWVGLHRWRLVTDLRVFSARTGNIRLWLPSR